MRVCKRVRCWRSSDRFATRDVGLISENEVAGGWAGVGEILGVGCEDEGIGICALVNLWSGIPWFAGKAALELTRFEIM